MKIRVNEALAEARANGRKILKKELAAKLWPNSSEHTQVVNMSNLCTGATKQVSPEIIKKLSEEIGVSSDFLLGIEKNNQTL